MEDLIKKAKKGNPDAFTELMQSQMQGMYKIAKSILYQDEDVADAISETILMCWEKIWQLKQAEYFRTWMTRILINKCNDIIRKKQKISFMEDIPESASYDTEYENTEWKEALNSLDEKYRLVLLLYYVEGFQTKEISRIMEVPESTIRTRLSRGREQLVKEFG